MWKCRVAPSLGALEGTPEEVWGIESWDKNETANYCDNVYFGVYGLNDFYTLWKHDMSKGQRAILWAGSDIRHLQKGYWLEDGGGIVLDNKGICEWINKYCDNYCENGVEHDALLDMGIESSIVPSFMGDVNDYEVSFKPNPSRTRVYASVSGDDFELYGWDKIKDIAMDTPDVEFHLYGNTVDWDQDFIPNIVVHGRVPKEQMNKEIKDMQGCIRPVEFDGFSEITAKAMLWGQYPISAIDYPGSIKLADTRSIRWKEEPNHESREWLLENVNKYPWNENNK